MLKSLSKYEYSKFKMIENINFKHCRLENIYGDIGGVQFCSLSYAVMMNLT